FPGTFLFHLNVRYLSRLHSPPNLINMKHSLVVLVFVLFIISCNGKQEETTANTVKADAPTTEKVESKEERNKKIIKEGTAALNDHNFDKLTSLMTDDAVDNGDGSGHTVKGRDSINASMKTFFSSFPDFKGEDFRYYADGD